MIRAERIVDAAKTPDELTVYNGLLPRSGELAATMFIEIGEAAQIKPVLTPATRRRLAEDLA
jgi:hypothetical protein